MIYRGRQGDIVFEFSVSPASRATIILCDGLPSVPKQRQVMDLLQAKGYNVFFPRYRGTWESGGNFLAQSPALDILELVALIKSGSVTELYSNQKFSTNPRLYLVGSSWGATVALSLADNPDVARVIAFSPIVDFVSHQQNSQGQNLQWLKQFIRRAFYQGYRFEDKDWERMLSGELFKPSLKLKPETTTIVYDRSDEEISSTDIETYCQIGGATAVQVTGIGHLSFSKIPPELWDQVLVG
ncbi:hypothetical protein IT398_02175 [Candidatus Nomurabacteria bacterium]|nr:hypothetical protein [Candidatus Nomurabacteria bacterium]